MDRYRIERASPAHLPALPEIERKAARRFLTFDWIEVDPEDVTPLADFEAAQRDGQLFVALAENDAPVGFALVHEHGGGAHLEEVDVLPDHGRAGLGRRLVERACDWARERSLPWVTLTTFREVPWNAPFYRRLGFEEIPATELDDEMREILAEEAERGLAPERRAFMRRPLGRDTVAGGGST